MNTLQYVVGEAKAGQPAVIRFFGRVTEETTSRFNDEFDFLENIIRPSCIRVLINSEGGSVLYGMSTYSTIANAPVDTECIIEGVAASMASIIWAAGKRSLMRDYAILMIHNPMLPDDDGGEPSDMVTAFTKQIETIYRKRFGLKAEHVRAIMDGQAGKDGTYFDAQAAVKAGIIPAEHVIHTSKQLCRKVHDEIEGLTDTAAIQELMSRVSAGNKPFKGIEPTLTETENDMANENKTQGFEYGAIAASLGMKDGEVKDVMARISELAAMEPKYREIQKSLSDAQTVIAGKDASIRNLQTDLLICGRQAIDGDTAQVGPQVAEKLGLTQITYAEEILNVDEAARRITVKRHIDGGVETVEGPLPIVITVNGSAAPCRPRNAKLVQKYKRAMGAQEKAAQPTACHPNGPQAIQYPELYETRPYLNIPEWSVADVNGDLSQCGLSGSPTKVKTIQNIVFQAKESKTLTGSDKDIEDMIVELLANHTIG